MIFWKYIKGFNQRSEESSVSSFYTFLAFSNNANNDPMPHIWINSTGTWDPTYTNDDQGAILTAGRDQNIYGNLTMVDSKMAISGTGSFGYYSGTSYRSFLSYTNNRIYFGNDSSDPIHITNCLVSSKYITIGTYSGTPKDGVLYAEEANITGKNSAGYFITTSDRRAKENIQDMNFNALDLVLKTPIYSFDYKETQTPSIGIIAQDVQDVQIGNFSLVDNKNASGIDFDYMHIHEGKLVYILWKAIQEQQKEIQALKELLKQ